MKYDAVLFVSFGGPEKKEDIHPFLEIVTHGRKIPPQRLEEVAHHYEKIGGASPINQITRAQAEGLQKILSQTDTPYPVYIGQRNWHPFIEDALRAMMKDGVKRAIGFCTAAHRSEASLERYVYGVEAIRQKIGPEAPIIDYVGPWFDHPLFIDALCQRIQDILPEDDALRNMAWVFTAHSIPCSMAKEATYVQELHRTAKLVCEKLNQMHWALAYTSRTGNPQDPWLEPDVNVLIRDYAQKGIRDILFIPIGFIADHVEVLFDLDIEAQATAANAGIQIHRTKTVGDHPLFLQMIADLVRHPVPQTALCRSSQITQYRTGGGDAKVGVSSSHCYCFPDHPNPPCKS